MNTLCEMLISMLPESADAALIISKQNKRYFAAFPSDDCYLLITRESAYLIVDFRYTEDAEAKSDGCKVITYKDLRETLGELCKRHALQSIMFEGSAFCLNEAARIEDMLSSAGCRAIKTAELDGIIEKLRITKTDKEIGHIRRAQFIAEQALMQTLPLVKEGVYESELALELEYRMRKLGAEGVSFDLIVIAGAKTSMPHGVPGDNRIMRGDFITFDIGTRFQGYCSDMTRTYAFGEVSEKQKRIYETVRQAQQLGLEAVRAGVRCCDVDSAARTYITHAGFGEYFGHSTGHGVGLDIHEAPAVSSRNEAELQSGMVITVEPGIYLPCEFGVRIEDMVVVTTDGCINLAALPKELTVLG